MKRWIERALNVRPGDLGRGVLLCSCLFLVICSYKIGGVAGAALFLPVSRHSSGLCSNFEFGAGRGGHSGIRAYCAAGSSPRLLVGSMVFFSTTCAVFWGLAHYYSA